MNFTTSNYGENGHIKISITNPIECGYIIFRIQDRSPISIHTVGLTMISCDCPELKGKCMKILLSKMITYLETRGANNETRIELMVEPDEKTGTSPISAMSKLKSHYKKFGFENDPTEPGLTAYMITTIGEIKQKIQYHLPRLNSRSTSRSTSRSRTSRNTTSYRRRHSKTGNIPVRRKSRRSSNK